MSKILKIQQKIIVIGVILFSFSSLSAQSFNANLVSQCIPSRIDFEFLNVPPNNQFLFYEELVTGKRIVNKNGFLNITQGGNYSVVMFYKNLNTNDTLVTNSKEFFIQPKVPITVDYAAGPNDIGDTVQRCVPFDFEFRLGPDSLFDEYASVFVEINNIIYSLTQLEESIPFTVPDIYSFNISALTQDGCEYAFSNDSIIRAYQKPDFSIKPSSDLYCEVPYEVKFEPIGVFSPDAEFNWDFDNNDNSQQKIDSTIYNDFGDYRPSLTISEPAGCATTVTYNSVYIKPIFLPGDKYTFSPFHCVGDSIRIVSNLDPRFYPFISFTWLDNSRCNSKDENDIVLGSNRILNIPASDTCDYSITVIVSPRPKFSECSTIDNISIPQDTVQFEMEKINQKVTCNAPITLPYLITKAFNIDSISLDNPNVVLNYSSLNTGDIISITFLENGIYDLDFLLTTNGDCEYSYSKGQLNLAKLVSDFELDYSIGPCLEAGQTGEVEVTPISSTNNNVSSVQYFYRNNLIASRPTLSPIIITEDEIGKFELRLIIETDEGCVDTVSSEIGFGKEDEITLEEINFGLCLGDTISLVGKGMLDSTKVNWFLNENLVEIDTLFNYIISTTDTLELYYQANHYSCATEVNFYTLIEPVSSNPELDFTVICSNPRKVNLNLSFNPNLNLESTELTASNALGTQIFNPIPPSFTLLEDSTYLILTTISEEGCKDTVDATISLVPKNFAIPDVQSPACQFSIQDFNFKPHPSTERFIFRRNGEILIDEGNLLNDEDYSGSIPIRIRPNQVGPNTFSLIQIDTFGCNTARTITVNAIQSPQISFDLYGEPGGCDSAQVEIAYTGADSITYTDYNWDFGNGTTSNKLNPGVIKYYSLVDSFFDITFTASNNLGCSHSVTYADTVKVYNPKIQYNLSKDSICIDDVVQISTTTLQGTDNLLGYQWDFGAEDESNDPDKVRFKNPAVRYDSDTGFFAIGLVFTDGSKYGCKDSVFNDSAVHVEDLEINLNVIGDSIALCPPFFPRFEANFNGRIQYYFWEISNNPFPQFENSSPIIVPFSYPGKYSITLNAISEFGCSRSIKKEDVIEIGGPILDIAFDYQGNCSPLELNIEHLITNEIDIQSTDFFPDDGNVLDTIPERYVLNRIRNPFEQFKFCPSVEIQGENCKVLYDTSYAQIECIELDSVIADINSNVKTDTFCKNDTIQLVQKAKRFDNIIWNVNNVYYSDDDTINLFLNSVDSIYIDLIARSIGGCNDTFQLQKFVNQTPSPLNIDTLHLACLDDTVRVSNNEFGSTYQWSPEEFFRNPFERIGNLFFTQDSLEYNVEITTAGGCTEQFGGIIVKYPELEVSITPDEIFTVGGETVQIDVISNAIDINWLNDFPNDFSITTRLFENQVIEFELTSPGSCETQIFRIPVNVYNEYSLGMPDVLVLNGGQDSKVWPRGFGIDKILSFEVYNRLGERVFQGSGTNIIWDGTFKGKQLPIDTYLYKVNALYLDGKKEQIIGEIAIVK